MALPRLGLFSSPCSREEEGSHRRGATGEPRLRQAAPGRGHAGGTAPTAAAPRPASSHLLHRSLSASRRRTHQVLGVLVHVGHAAPVLLVEEQHVPHP